MAVSCPNFNNAITTEDCKLTAKVIVRSLPDGETIYKFEHPVKASPGVPFRCAIVSADGSNIIVATIDKTGKDAMSVYNAENGTHIHKVTLRGSGIKEMVSNLRIFRIESLINPISGHIFAPAQQS